MPHGRVTTFDFSSPFQDRLRSAVEGIILDVYQGCLRDLVNAPHDPVGRFVDQVAGALLMNGSASVKEHIQQELDYKAVLFVMEDIHPAFLHANYLSSDGELPLVPYHFDALTRIRALFGAGWMDKMMALSKMEKIFREIENPDHRAIEIANHCWWNSPNESG